jgi:hypothetical protein
MAAYDRRMAMIRNGDTLAPETSTKEEKDEWDRKQLTYNFEQDERAHLAKIRVSQFPAHRVLRDGSEMRCGRRLTNRHRMSLCRQN